MGDDSTVLDLLVMEYEKLQSAIDKFDDQRFKIRSWTVTAAGALTALAINAKTDSIYYGAELVVVFFGYLELIFMSTQAAVIRRSNTIEALIEDYRRSGAGTAHDEYVFGIGKVFIGPDLVSFKGIRILLKNRSHITVFYLGLSVALLGAALVL